MQQAEAINMFHQIILLLLLAIVVGITYISLRYCDRLMQMLGVTGMNVLTRVFGIILAALAVQSIINGLMILLKAYKAFV